MGRSAGSWRHEAFERGVRSILRADGVLTLEARRRIDEIGAEMGLDRNQIDTGVVRVRLGLDLSSQEPIEDRFSRFVEQELLRLRYLPTKLEHELSGIGKSLCGLGVQAEEIVTKVANELSLERINHSTGKEWLADQVRSRLGSRGIVNGIDRSKFAILGQSFGLSQEEVDEIVKRHIDSIPHVRRKKSWRIKPVSMLWGLSLVLSTACAVTLVWAIAQDKEWNAPLAQSSFEENPASFVREDSPSSWAPSQAVELLAELIESDSEGATLRHAFFESEPSVYRIAVLRTITKWLEEPVADDLTAKRGSLLAVLHASLPDDEVAKDVRSALTFRMQGAMFDDPRLDRDLTTIAFCEAMIAEPTLKQSRRGAARREIERALRMADPSAGLEGVFRNARKAVFDAEIHQLARETDPSNAVERLRRLSLASRRTFPGEVWQDVELRSLVAAIPSLGDQWNEVGSWIERQVLGGTDVSIQAIVEAVESNGNPSLANFVVERIRPELRVSLEKRGGLISNAVQAIAKSNESNQMQGQSSAWTMIRQMVDKEEATLRNFGSRAGPEEWTAVATRFSELSNIAHRISREPAIAIQERFVFPTSTEASGESPPFVTNEKRPARTVSKKLMDAASSLLVEPRDGSQARAEQFKRVAAAVKQLSSTNPELASRLVSYLFLPKSPEEHQASLEMLKEIRRDPWICVAFSDELSRALGTNHSNELAEIASILVGRPVQPTEISTGGLQLECLRAARRGFRELNDVRETKPLDESMAQLEKSYRVRAETLDSRFAALGEASDPLERCLLSLGRRVRAPRSTHAIRDELQRQTAALGPRNDGRLHRLAIAQRIYVAELASAIATELPERSAECAQVLYEWRMATDSAVSIYQQIAEGERGTVRLLLLTAPRRATNQSTPSDSTPVPLSGHPLADAAP